MLFLPPIGRFTLRCCGCPNLPLQRVVYKAIYPSISPYFAHWLAISIFVLLQKSTPFPSPSSVCPPKGSHHFTPIEMLPPSDSINHHNLKLAEFVAGLQNQSSMPTPPPPPYTPRQQVPPPLANEELLGQVDDIDDDPCNPAPIVIKIDSSIHVDGHGNTVAIPSSLSSAGPENAQQGQQSSPTADTVPPATPTSPTLHQMQLQRQAKSAHLATSIVAGLRSSGALEDDETGKSRPIEISVNAGIHIKGNKNVVCAGTTRPERFLGSLPPSSGSASTRKRRAVSVRRNNI